jgi:hypothetical protein
LKIALVLKNPELAVQAELQEAHIRMISGAWLAMKWTNWIVLIGLIISIVGLLSGFLGNCDVLTKQISNTSGAGPFSVLLR